MTEGSIRAGTLGAALALAACAPQSQPDPAAQTRVPVSLATVVRDSIPAQLAVIGRLEPIPGGSALLAASAAGIVARLPVQVGSPVRRGAVVAELSVPELSAMASAQAATATQARREAERQHRLLADGVTSERQAEEAATAARTAAAAAEAARRVLDQTRVRTPIAGQVQRVGVRLGQRVDAGAFLAEVLRADTLDLLVALPSAEVARVAVGQRARVRADGATDGGTAAGRVVAIAPGLDSLTNAGQVVIRVPNPGGVLRAWSGATGTITLGMRRGVLVVPQAALALAGDHQVVFVVGADSVARERAVVPGVRNGDSVEVGGALREGERIVVVGAAGLQDGMRVVAVADTTGSERARP